MTDHHDRLAFESGEARYDGWIICKTTVAVKLSEITEYGVDIRHRIGAFRVSGEEALLPGRQGGKHSLDLSIKLAPCNDQILLGSRT